MIIQLNIHSLGMQCSVAGIGAKSFEATRQTDSVSVLVKFIGNFMPYLHWYLTA